MLFVSEKKSPSFIISHSSIFFPSEWIQFTMMSSSLLPNSYFSCLYKADHLNAYISPFLLNGSWSKGWILIIFLNPIAFTRLNLSMGLSTWFEGSRFNINAVRMQKQCSTSVVWRGLLHCLMPPMHPCSKCQVLGADRMCLVSSTAQGRWKR